MELLMTNQPWNLILFMAIPVILAEITAITEFFILFRQSPSRGLRALNKVAGLIAGFYFLGVFVYLVANAVIPLTAGGQWRGLVDILAVGFYLSGVVPLFGISLLELGAIARNRTDSERRGLHVKFVSWFLVVAHAAMILGMLNPTLFTATPAGM